MKKKKINIVTNKYGCIDIEETLYQQRHIFINNIIERYQADKIIKELIVLDMISDKPIQMYVTSPGGQVDWGFAIIDVMQKIRSKVITIANGQVASMGTLITIAGDERKCFKNTNFMFHDMFSGVIDYSQKMKARLNFTEKLYKRMEKHIFDNTKLTQKEVDVSRNEELWIFADDAVKKGLVDTVIE